MSTVFKVGDLVWQQMWSPMAELEPKTVPYGRRRGMKLAGIGLNCGAPDI